MQMYQEATLSREGLQLLDSYFFEARSKTITKGNSWYDTQHNPEKLEKITKLAERYKTTPYQAFQLWWGSVNQFRPAIAKWVYTRYKPTRILDFSAGWGGRCLGAIELGVPYVGIDSNQGLKQCYESLLRDHPGDVTMHFQPSETFDFSAVDYDMVLTSPPYFMIERYECMPIYKTKAEFLSVFFRPVIERVWENLKSGGVLCLNMPEAMYEGCKDLLPALHETLDMPLYNRFSKTSKTKRKELIYVWKKNWFEKIVIVKTRDFERSN